VCTLRPIRCTRTMQTGHSHLAVLMAPPGCSEDDTTRVGRAATIDALQRASMLPPFAGPLDASGGQGVAGTHVAGRVSHHSLQIEPAISPGRQEVDIETTASVDSGRLASLFSKLRGHLSSTRSPTFIKAGGGVGISKAAAKSPFVAEQAPALSPSGTPSAFAAAADSSFSADLGVNSPGRLVTRQGAAAGTVPCGIITLEGACTHSNALLGAMFWRQSGGHGTCQAAVSACVAMYAGALSSSIATFP
jgi:hypothetical protein